MAEIEWPEFHAYDRANPKVWWDFCAEVKRQQRSGRTKGSARAILDYVIRWADQRVSIKNAMSCFYARKWLSLYHVPGTKPFFDLGDSVANDGWSLPTPEDPQQSLF